ncbi:MAG: AAA family ATPase [Bacteroidaceae bacterium]|nr:AAA family ATPase [Bacteroidaceae bacterium]
MATNETSRAELERQLSLLRAEYEAEKEEFRQQTLTMGIGRKVKRGLCWFPLTVGRSYYNSLNQFVVEVFRTEDTDVEHNFEYGRPVCFFSEGDDGTLSYFNFTATVNYADSERMVVVLPRQEVVADIAAAQRLGVQLYFDETSYKLMFEAMRRVIDAKDGRLFHLREIFHGSLPPATYTFAPQRFPWLNPSQEQAVNNVLWAKDVAIVHGPPGTGKTTTLVEAIYETLHRESQVLVCAQSNMAVDWICEKLVDRGVAVLRIGNPTKVNDKMLSFTYERQFESHPDYAELWSVRKAIRQVRSSKGMSRDERHQKLGRLKERAAELEFRINESLFNNARVISSTLVGSASRVLMGQKFSTLFIDEAAQALEAACWIAIRKAGRVIFAGDHMQLPPTVKSREAMKGGLSVTLMERIARNKPQAVSLLQMQYRMNERIMKFSSDYFYEGKIIPAPDVRFRGILDFDTPMVWVDTSAIPDAHEQFVGESYGRINKEEARLTLENLQAYFDKIGKERLLAERIDVGVISPYRAQVQYMRRLIAKSAYFKPYRHLITVNTVDGFQGQERDVIVISLVRSNDKGEIGFLGDLRRMNVAITRARMKVIILGNVETLCRHPFYNRLYEYISSL